MSRHEIERITKEFTSAYEMLRNLDFTAYTDESLLRYLNDSIHPTYLYFNQLFATKEKARWFVHKRDMQLLFLNPILGDTVEERQWIRDLEYVKSYKRDDDPEKVMRYIKNQRAKKIVYVLSAMQSCDKKRGFGNSYFYRK
jgi:hypothetical protein